VAEKYLVYVLRVEGTPEYVGPRKFEVGRGQRPIRPRDYYDTVRGLVPGRPRAYDTRPGS